MRVCLEIILVRPFGASLDTLLQMSNLWRCDLIRVSPNRALQRINMPLEKFRAIWGKNAVKGTVAVPSGTEDFIETIKVLRIVP